MQQSERGDAIWSIALSPDKDQRFLIYADGENTFVRMVNRKSGEALGTFGHNGRNAGQFHWIHQIAIDSHSNIYTGEVDTAFPPTPWATASARSGASFCPSWTRTFVHE